MLVRPVVSDHRVSRVVRGIRACRVMLERVFRVVRVSLVFKVFRDRFHKGHRGRKVSRDCLVVSRDSRERLARRGIKAIREMRDLDFKGSRVRLDSREAGYRGFRATLVRLVASGRRVSRAMLAYRVSKVMLGRTEFRVFRDWLELAFRDRKVLREMLERVFRDSRATRERKDSKDCKVRFHKGLRDQKVYKDCQVVFRDSKACRDQEGSREILARRGFRAMLACRVIKGLRA
jgi:hypothetical protein